MAEGNNYLVKIGNIKSGKVAPEEDTQLAAPIVGSP